MSSECIQASGHTEQSGIEKNKVEYNATADAYQQWSETNVLLNEYNYYSGIAELEKEGIEGKTCLEVGCGPCPIGQRLVAKGAKKVYGVDISEQMVANTETMLREKNLLDKFELIAHDIFDETFSIAEPVDCVVASYAITAFVSNYNMLLKLLQRCRQFIKQDGFVQIVDFSYYAHPRSLMDVTGMCQLVPKGGEAIHEFEIFHFFIDQDPDHAFEIFHIPDNVVFRAAREAGFSRISMGLQYPNPEMMDHPAIKAQMTLDTKDYIFKLRN